MIYNIMIVGVGGQGTLLASRILGEYAMINGYDCKLSEVHGMAQRGGSVVTYVRMGDEPINSPIIDIGEADIIIAFEKLEAGRWKEYLKKGGIIAVNNEEINPMTVIVGLKKYPHEILEVVKEKYTCIEVPASDLARESGSIKAVNTIMLGVLCKAMNLDLNIMTNALENVVKKQFIEMNKKAILIGYGYGR